MIYDPADPNYRYPAQGERLWDDFLTDWVTVDDSAYPADYTWRFPDEVPVLLDDGTKVVTKLRHLTKHP